MVLYRLKSLQDVVNPPYSGLSPTEPLQIRLKAPHEKRGYFFKKGQKCKVTTNNVTMRCGVKKGKRGACKQKAATVLPDRTAAT